MTRMVVAVGLVLMVGSVVFDRPRAQAAPEDDIAAMLDALMVAWNQEDTAAVLTYFTEEGLVHNFVYESGDDAAAVIEANRADVGPITSIAVSSLFVTSGNATGIVELKLDGFTLYEKWQFYYLDGGWRIGDGAVAQRPIPQGVTPVALDLQEYAFSFDKSAVASGDVAFRVRNAGVQLHEAILLELDTTKTFAEVVDDMLPSEGADLPAGVNILDSGGDYEPGEEKNIVFGGPLQAGRYAFVCFQPSPEGIPHAALGMATEFTVGAASSGGSIVPPSTGNAGLIGAGGNIASWLALSIAMTLVLAGAGGILNSMTPRKRR